MITDYIAVKVLSIVTPAVPVNTKIKDNLCQFCFVA